MSFPDFSHWVTRVLNPRDCLGGDSPWRFDTLNWYEAYRVKNTLCGAVSARSVLEIGVRYGYGAHAFLSSGAVDYIGVDLDSATVNAMGGPTLSWAKTMLERECPHASVEFIRKDTQKEDLRGFLRPVDFSHVDANHTQAGALRDMALAWSFTMKAMLVDDYASSPPVTAAVKAFALSSGAALLTSTSGNGEALFLR